MKKHQRTKREQFTEKELYGKRKLLATNAKLEKNTGAAANYLIAGLTLAPHSVSGFNVCPEATTGCRASCNLHFAGQRVMAPVRERALRDTFWLLDRRAEFLAQLNKDIAAHVRKAERAKLIPLIRLNVASDLDWAEVIARWPNVVFYDYTKVRSRFNAYLDGQLPANYRLIFSASENSADSLLADYLTRGGNVAMVFAVDYYPSVKRIGPLPSGKVLTGRAFDVIDGDKHDVRLPEIDGRGVIVGLRLKGTNAAKARGIANEFAR